MQLTFAKENLGKVAAILGIVQGCVWTLITLIAIIFHYWGPDINNINESYEQLLAYLIYYRFIVEGDFDYGVTFVITQTAFSVFMWLYFFGSVAWSALSIDLIVAIQAQKGRQVLVMRLWGIATFLISLLDLLLGLLLAIDFTSCGVGPSKVVTQSQYLCYLVNGIMMTLAERGFTLLVVNIIFSILLIRISSSVDKEDTNESLYSTIPRARLRNKIAPKLNEYN